MELARGIGNPRLARLIWFHEVFLRVLVTGGAGYIGSHACRLLRRQGYDVIVYDNLSTGHESFAGDNELVVGDVGDAAALVPVLRRVDAVMHFAAHIDVGESVQNPRKYFHNNATSALILLDAAVDAGVRHVVFSSTAAVYGTPAVVPITEDAARCPINPYGAAKLFVEQALEAYERAYGLRFASLRYFNAAGADESGEIGERHSPETHAIPLVLAAAAGEVANFNLYGDDYPTPDGTCIRDYIHVNDLAAAHLAALEHLVSGASSLQVNLGTGSGHSVRELIAVAEEITGRRVPVRIAPRRPGDSPELVADPSRAKEILSWQTTRSLQDIVATAWKWAQSQYAREPVMNRSTPA
jgi:UDP-glucose 4-epimerase